MRTVPLLALLALAGCAVGGRTAPPDSPPAQAGGVSPGPCPEPAGEFGAGGCAVVQGRVVDRQGQPLSGRGLAGGVAPREGCTACNAPGLVIDDAGRFSQTVHWFASDPPESAVVWVHVAGVGPGYPVERGRPVYADSARVVVRFAPIGRPAVAAPEVVLRLGVPGHGAGSR